jgi:hypothetical protein
MNSAENSIAASATTIASGGENGTVRTTAAAPSPGKAIRVLRHLAGGVAVAGRRRRGLRA